MPPHDHSARGPWQTNCIFTSELVANFPNQSGTSNGNCGAAAGWHNCSGNPEQCSASQIGVMNGYIDDFEAIMQASKRRLRPIMLTSLTTFFGLAPMIMETDMQARFLVPMAISLGFGVLFATVVVVLLVPCFYLILEDFLRPFFGEPQAEQSSQSESAPT